MNDEARAFEMALEIEASPEELWKALTQAGELVRWFPLQAEVPPGPGGSMRWSWEEAWDWRTRIDGWEPPRRLRLVQVEDQAYDAEGRPVETKRKPAAPIALEFTLEAGRGSTRLRIVHSGFGRGAEWDDEFDGISAGWPVVLRTLRHYLQRHRGRDRHVARAVASAGEPIAAVWARLTGPDGFALEPARPQAGAPFAVSLPGGDRYQGTTELFIPERVLMGIVAGDGVLELSTHRAEGRTGMQAWLSKWGARDAALDRFGEGARKALDRLFGGS